MTWNKTQKSRFPYTETEFNGNRVHWTRFSCLVHPIHLTRSREVLSWKWSLLDLIFVNGPQHSTCCRGSQLGTCLLFVRLIISQTEHLVPYTLFSSSQFNSFQHSILSEYTTLITTLLSDRALSSLHSSHTTFQVYNILFASFFLLRKNLEHIRTMFYFILFFFC